MNEPETIYDCINSYRDKQVVYEVSGTLVKLYPKKNTQHGTLQNGELDDGQGNVIKVTFADCPKNEKTARNQWVTLKSTQSQQHGWTGVKIKDDAYGRCLWVTPSASVVFNDGGHHEDLGQGAPPARPPQVRPPQGRPPQGAQGRQQAAPTSKPPQQENQWTFLERTIDAYDAIYSLVHEKMGEKATDAAIATVFIEAAKAGVISRWSPSAQKPKKYPEPPDDPNDWRFAYIPSGSLEGKKLEEIGNEELIQLHRFLDDKKSNSKFAECVYRAVEELKLLAPKAGAEPELDPTAEDDIPF